MRKSSSKVATTAAAPAVKTIVLAEGSVSNAFAELTVLPMTCLRDSTLFSDRANLVGERVGVCLACGELDGVSRRDSAGLMEFIRGLEGVSDISRRREDDD